MKKFLFGLCSFFIFSSIFITDVKSPGIDNMNIKIKEIEAVSAREVNTIEIKQDISYSDNDREIREVKKTKKDNFDKNKYIEKENQVEVKYIKVNGKEIALTNDYVIEDNVIRNIVTGEEIILPKKEIKEDEKIVEEVSDNNNDISENIVSEENILEQEILPTPTPIPTPIPTPVKGLILDMDFSTDVDDACALRLAVNLHNMGELDLKAVTLCVNGPDDINMRAADGLLDYGNVHVPIGRSSIHTDDKSPYWEVLSQYSDGVFDSYDSVKLWRKIISENEKVNILTTGYLTNLQAFCQSGPDEYSPLTGMELLHQKVENVYIIGGSFPSGVDNNFAYKENAIKAAEWVSRNVTKPLLYITNDVGGPLTCGGSIQKTKPDDPLSKALFAFGTTWGRVAWDPVGVFIATYGITDGFGIQRMNIDITNGTNHIYLDDNGAHYRVYRTSDDYEWYNHRLEVLCY